VEGALLSHTHAEFSRARKERITERLPPRSRPFRSRGIVPGRRNGELVVTSERLRVLSPAERERLRIEERSRIPEHNSRPGAQSQNDRHWLAAQSIAAADR